MNLNQQRAASILKAYEPRNKSLRDVIEEKFAKGVIDQTLYESALNQLETFEKGGEGSKGGKVIGHTRSGKPIYASKSGDHKDYKEYSEEDHKDAYVQHVRRAEQHGYQRGADNLSKEQRHRKTADSHSQLHEGHKHWNREDLRGAIEHDGRFKYE